MLSFSVIDHLSYNNYFIRSSIEVISCVSELISFIALKSLEWISWFFSQLHLHHVVGRLAEQRREEIAKYKAKYIEAWRKIDAFYDTPTVLEIKKILGKSGEVEWGIEGKGNQQLELLQNLVRGMSRKLRKYPPETAMNAIARDLMMDKLFIHVEEDDQGMALIVAAPEFQQAFKRLEKNQMKWSISQEIVQLISALNARFSPLLETLHDLIGLQYQLLIRTEKTSRLPSTAEVKEYYRKEYVGKILVSLQELKEGDSLLIPIRCKIQHGILLLITRTDSQFRLVCYNTGGGLNYHYSWRGSFHVYQTYDVIDQVPSESVLNEDGWKKQSIDFDKMDSVYEWMRSHIGQGGVRLPASENQEDYEEMQFSDSCVVQGLMAWMRHEIMQMAVGDPPEKEACYKMIKTYLFLQYLEDNTGKFDEEIQCHLSTVEAKLKSEQMLIQIAGDERRMEIGLAAFREGFNLFGQQAYEKYEKVGASLPVTVLARYALLRRLSTVLFHLILAQPEKIPSEDLEEEALQLVKAKLKHHGAVRNNLERLLTKKAKTDKVDFVATVMQLFFGTPHANLAITQAAEHLGSEFTLPRNPSSLMQRWLNVLKQENFGNTESFVQRFSQELAVQGKLEFAEWVSQYWKELA